MKKTMAAKLAWVVVLGFGLGAVSRAEQEYAEKLINAEDIVAEFEQGKEKVKVIVNLAEPQRIKSTTDWNLMQSLKKLHNEVMATQAPVLSTLSTNEFKLRHRFENQPGFSGEVTLEGLAKLLNDPRVESIEPVYVLEKNLKQGIPLINALRNRPDYIGQGVAIAICDDGIDYYHQKLGGADLQNNTKVIGGYDFGEDDSDPFPIRLETEAHGTACAGIAAGDLGDTGDYIGGVAPGAKLYALKVTEINPIDGTVVIYGDTVIKAINWCINHKNDNQSYPILVISISLGGGRFYSSCDAVEPALKRAANNAVSTGITVLASAGNDGYCDSIGSPACLGNVISVGAVYDAAFLEEGYIQGKCVDPNSCAGERDDRCDTGWICWDIPAADRVKCNSNIAFFLDILAPADNAYTTDITGSGGYTAGDYISDFGDTSAACPYAAGAVACLQSASKAHTGGYLTPSDVRDLLTSTGDDITDSKVDITKPRVNLGLAIDSLRGVECDNITIGTGTSNWNYPMHTVYEDSRTQVIYLASEIGGSGNISALALDVTKVPDEAIRMNNWTIRMQHTSEYSSCRLDGELCWSLLDPCIDPWTVVYQNDETVYSTGWRIFEFQRPFEYNGTDHLMMDFSFNNRFSASDGECRSHEVIFGQRSTCAQSDGQYGDPLNWSGTSRPNVCTVIFEDTFPSPTINANNWADFSRPGILVGGPRLDAPPDYSLGLGLFSRPVSPDWITSKAIDLSPYTSATLSHYLRRNYESDYDLLIEYWDGWEWREFVPSSNGPVLSDDPSVTAVIPSLGYERILDLPSEALRRDFKLRIRIVYAGEGEPVLTPADTVLWFVDDVKIEGT
ncbi:MAG: S8 family peptidase [Planctomycetota bacterium]